MDSTWTGLYDINCQKPQPRLLLPPNPGLSMLWGTLASSRWVVGDVGEVGESGSTRVSVSDMESESFRPWEDVKRRSEYEVGLLAREGSDSE